MEHTLTRIKDHADLTVAELRTLVDPLRLPRHMAIIMDGNGRWAAKKGLPRIAGHKRGMEVVHEVVTACAKLGVPALTLYAFSTENWKRPAPEVSFLMSLLTLYLRQELSLMKRENIRFSTIGLVEDLPSEARAWIDKAKAETASNAGMVLDLALSYGGRREIIEAAKKIAADMKSGKIEPSALDERTFSGYLDTREMPELDLVIRTSGEQRVSNFLLWQMAYAELYFTEALWPDFTERDLLIAILDYQGRQRRFGKTSEQLGS